VVLAQKERERLKRILDLSDRLGSLRKKVRETAMDRKGLTDEVRSIAGSVVTIGLPGSLGKLAQSHRLEPHHVMVLLLLLNRRFESSEGTLTGREILSTLFPSTFGVLSGTALLGTESTLLISGAVEPFVDTQGVLDTRFRISDVLFEQIEGDATPAGAIRAPARPYRNHYEHLADLAALTSLLLRRSIAAFDVDPYGHRLFEEAEPAPLIDRKAIGIRARIAERLAGTGEADNFPLVRLARRLRLTDDEQLILIALLVQECYYGSPGLEAVECVKMVSRGPEELLQKRPILSPDAALRRAGLVEIVDSVDEREITGDLMLPRWVSALLLGESDGEDDTPIGTDTRIEFHEYLKELEDSDRFFKDLGDA
jgi:hypothetical protein